MCENILDSLVPQSTHETLQQTVVCAFDVKTIQPAGSVLN